MKLETLFELIKCGFSIFIIIWCFANLFTGLKDISKIDDIMKDRKTK